MGITSFNHYTVRSGNLDAAWKFYEQALGLKVEARQGTAPGVRAAIVWCGDTQVVHLFQASAEMEAVFATLPTFEQSQGWTTGRLHHVEFWAQGLPEMRERLKANRVSFTERALPDKYQVAMRDADQIQVNLNFQLSEAPS